MKYFSVILMMIACIMAIIGEYKYNFYYEDLIIMYMLVAIFLRVNKE